MLSLLRAELALQISALVTCGALAAVLVVGLRRNWQTSQAGWGLIGTHLIASSIIGFIAVRHVQASSQDGIVLSNIRGLSAAADQYYIEYGVSSVDFPHLVGATNYIRSLNTAANENYPAVYTQGMTITVTGVAGLRTITYAP